MTDLFLGTRTFEEFTPKPTDKYPEGGYVSWYSKDPRKETLYPEKTRRTCPSSQDSSIYFW